MILSYFRQNILVPDDFVFEFVDLDFVPGVLPGDDLVSDFQVNRRYISILVLLSGTYRYNLINMGSFFIGVFWEVDTTLGNHLSFHSSQEYSIGQRLYLHRL